MELTSKLISARTRTDHHFKVEKTIRSDAQGFFKEGSKLKQAGDLAGALDAFRQSAKLSPRSAAPWIGLADVLAANQQPKDALECLKRAAMGEPRNAMVQTRLARAFHDLGVMEKARVAYERALKIDPTKVSALFSFGQWHEDQGDAESAADCYRRLLAVEPGHAEALGAIVGLGREIDVSSEMAMARATMDSADDRGKALIGYGLGRALDRQGYYKAAFAVLTEANAARARQAGPFDREAFDRRVDGMINLFSSGLMQEREGWGVTSERPVFVVGLPRSGTTLTEQIAGSHPSCDGAGELPDLSDLATGTPDRLGSNDVCWPECVTMLEQQHIAALGEDYISRIAKRCPADALRVIDKQPLNFWHLGLVAISLPNARIIHCTRDIRANGLSIFAQNFSLDQQWATDLGDIAYYWQGYRRLMAHWQNVTGLRVLSVAYEDTVADLESQARRLLEFLDLDWDKRVLAYHKNERAVQTPSRWQVRQPLYTSSKEKWRRYEPHLEPLTLAMQTNTSAT
ncbi:MAG: sulfotransferase [Pseudomonadota bacterium]